MFRVGLPSVERSRLSFQSFVFRLKCLAKGSEGMIGPVLRGVAAAMLANVDIVLRLLAHSCPTGFGLESLHSFITDRVV